MKLLKPFKPRSTVTVLDPLLAFDDALLDKEPPDRWGGLYLTALCSEANNALTKIAATYSVMNWKAGTAAIPAGNVEKILFELNPSEEKAARFREVVKISNEAIKARIEAKDTAAAAEVEKWAVTKEAEKEAQGILEENLAKKDLKKQPRAAKNKEKNIAIINPSTQTLGAAVSTSTAPGLVSTTQTSL